MPKWCFGGVALTLPGSEIPESSRARTNVRSTVCSLPDRQAGLLGSYSLKQPHISWFTQPVLPHRSGSVRKSKRPFEAATTYQFLGPRPSRLQSIASRRAQPAREAASVIYCCSGNQVQKPHTDDPSGQEHLDSFKHHVLDVPRERGDIIIIVRAIVLGGPTRAAAPPTFRAQVELHHFILTTCFFNLSTPHSLSLFYRHWPTAATASVFSAR